MISLETSFAFLLGALCSLGWAFLWARRWASTWARSTLWKLTAPYRVDVREDGRIVCSLSMHQMAALVERLRSAQPSDGAP